jgi:hypothetical protein
MMVSIGYLRGDVGMAVESSARAAAMSVEYG